MSHDDQETAEGHPVSLVGDARFLKTFGVRVIRPTANNVHLLPIPNPSVTAGGLHLVQPNPGECTYFKVLAVGPKVQEIAVGDKVIVRLIYDSATLDDGSKITDAKQVEMVV